MTYTYDSQKMHRDAGSTTQETPSFRKSYHMNSLKHTPLWAKLAYGDEVIPSLSISASPLQRKSNATALPDTLKAGIEGLSGLSMDDVQVHYQSSQPARVQALAYTQGTDIYVGPDQEQHLPHEAWHVVQQKQGRAQATSQAQGFAINDNQGLEKEADIMSKQAEAVGGKILRQNPPIIGMESPLPHPGAIQRTVGKYLEKGDKVITKNGRRGTIYRKSESKSGYYVNIEGREEPGFYEYNELDEDTGQEKREEQTKRKKAQDPSEERTSKKVSKSKEEVPAEFDLDYNGAVAYAAKLSGFSVQKKYLEEWLKFHNKPISLYTDMISDVVKYKSKETAISQPKETTISQTRETEPSGSLFSGFTTLSEVDKEKILGFKEDATEQYRQQINKNATGKFPYKKGDQAKAGNYRFTFQGDSAQRHVEEYVRATGDRLRELVKGQAIYTVGQLARDLLQAAAKAVDNNTLGQKGSDGTVEIQGSLSSIIWHLIIEPRGHSVYNIAHAHINEYVTGLED